MARLKMRFCRIVTTLIAGVLPLLPQPAGAQKNIKVALAYEASGSFGFGAPGDLLNSRRNPFISFHPAGIAVVGFVARHGIGLVGSFALGAGLCEALMAQVDKYSYRLGLL